MNSMEKGLMWSVICDDFFWVSDMWWVEIYKNKQPKFVANEFELIWQLLPYKC